MDIFIIITLTITSIASIVYLLNLSKKEISGTKGIPQNHEKKALRGMALSFCNIFCFVSLTLM